MLTTKTVDFSVNAGCFRSRGSSAGHSFACDVGVRACDAEALRGGSLSPIGAAAPAAWRYWPRFVENCQRLAVGGDLRPRLQCRFAKKASSRTAAASWIPNARGQLFNAHCKTFSENRIVMTL